MPFSKFVCNSAGNATTPNAKNNRKNQEEDRKATPDPIPASGIVPAIHNMLFVMRHAVWVGPIVHTNVAFFVVIVRASGLDDATAGVTVIVGVSATVVIVIVAVVASLKKDDGEDGCDNHNGVLDGLHGLRNRNDVVTHVGDYITDVQKFYFRF